MKRYFIVFFLLIGCYLAFDFASCLLPLAPIRHNVLKGMEQGDMATDYPVAIIPKEQAKLDNYSDAIILNQACQSEKFTMLERMLYMPRAHFSMVQTSTLWESLHNEVTEYDFYVRYWHGSTFLMRFLLTFLTYPMIRLWLFLFSSLLLLWLALELYRKAGAFPAIALIASFTLCYGYLMQFSIQFFCALALALSASIYVCHHHQEWKKIAFALFIIGSLTAFFDLLTVPLLTIGLPMVVFVFLTNREPNPAPLGRQIGQVAGISSIWMAGYFLTWAMKWTLTTVLTPINGFVDAFSQMGFYTSSKPDISRWDSVIANLNFLPYKFLICAGIFFLICTLISPRKSGWRNAILLFLIALTPYVWYLSLSVHSRWHFWFTHRNQIFTTFALLLAAAGMVDWQRLINLPWLRKVFQRKNGQTTEQ